jgi:hypothetical protein
VEPGGAIKGELIVDWDLSTIRQAKHLPAADLAGVITDLAIVSRTRVGALRKTLDVGTVFRVPEGEKYDTALVETALLALVMADVSLIDTFSKKRQLEAIEGACKVLDLSFDEVRRLTEYENRLEVALGSKA